jgi:hypothetical protein
MIIMGLCRLYFMYFNIPRFESQYCHGYLLGILLFSYLPEGMVTVSSHRYAASFCTISFLPSLFYAPVYSPVTRLPFSLCLSSDYLQHADPSDKAETLLARSGKRMQIALSFRQTGSLKSKILKLWPKSPQKKSPAASRGCAGRFYDSPGNLCHRHVDGNDILTTTRKALLSGNV